jgi:hypothetical protein
MQVRCAAHTKFGVSTQIGLGSIVGVAGGGKKRERGEGKKGKGGRRGRRKLRKREEN